MEQGQKFTIRQSRDLLISLFPECETKIKADVDCFLKFGPEPEKLTANCAKENWDCTLCISLCDAAKPLQNCLQSNNYQKSACQNEINKFLTECKPENLKEKIEKRAAATAAGKQ
ncbi:hypothetical protein SAMD00019534_038540 [Acytostelium subglobosum LB1]|uniref:hypothetical protein n=1 Tax=Acytostelium subglobosum LB1 TaxID=1410327 RepID=UPI000644FBA7|nr:hypothetical protein SAMD00019534_038540 [Acytostelium subglobosum LB1]GAM20679.1 hypothetical protein SAMD00019534_038540 [Acytostelium subglobosum LB1]|eukprot:XP_012760200.1 hypothetical protein SAMD00019534_038540 [Acytostelium subglobosum LB1]